MINHEHIARVYSHLDFQIGALQAQIRTLRQGRNEVTPVYHFPPEVVVKVFEHLQGLYASTNGILRWLTVIQVSRRWRDIALGAPSLWARIPLDGGRWVEESLRRSKEVGISVQLPWVIWTHYHAAEKIVPHIHRVKVLHLCMKQVQSHRRHLHHQHHGGLVVTSQPDVLPHLVRPAPLLESLHLSSYHPGREELIPLPDHLFGGETPRLRDLSLDQCLFKWKHLLPLLSDRITRLTITNPGTKVAPGCFLHALAGATRLRELTLKYVFLDDMTTPTVPTTSTTSAGSTHAYSNNSGSILSFVPQVTLPSLQSLSYHGSCLHQDLTLFSRFKLPNRVTTDFWSICSSADAIYESCLPETVAALMPFVAGFAGHVRAMAYHHNDGRVVRLKLWDQATLYNGEFLSIVVSLGSGSPNPANAGSPSTMPPMPIASGLHNNAHHHHHHHHSPSNSISNASSFSQTTSNSSNSPPQSSSPPTSGESGRHTSQHRPSPSRHRHTFSRHHHHHLRDTLWLSHLLSALNLAKLQLLSLECDGLSSAALATAFGSLPELRAARLWDRCGFRFLQHLVRDAARVRAGRPELGADGVAVGAPAGMDVCGGDGEGGDGDMSEATMEDAGRTMARGWACGGEYGHGNGDGCFPALREVEIKGADLQELDWDGLREALAARKVLAANVAAATGMCGSHGGCNMDEDSVSTLHQAQERGIRKLMFDNCTFEERSLRDLNAHVEEVHNYARKNPGF